MARHRLTNDDWGVESSCFVCEASNRHGLGLSFWADDERSVVEAEFALPAAYSGAPAVVHGGISLALLDEAQAWAVIAFGRQFGVTIETSARFSGPVWIDHDYRVEGRVVGREGDVFSTDGRIVAADGTVCVEATARFLAVGEASAATLAADSDDGNERLRRFLDPG
ncbi:MAG: PaaI family thioesterase [Actinomycetota bacterium]